MFHQWSLYLRMLVKGLQLKTTVLLVFFQWLVKSEKLVNNSIVDHLEKCGILLLHFNDEPRVQAREVGSEGPTVQVEMEILRRTRISQRRNR